MESQPGKKMPLEWVPQAAPKLRIDRHLPEIEDAIARVLRSGRYILGEECEAFENEFARFLGVPFVVGVNSGTDALSLALVAVGVEPGHDVIVPALTAAATAVAVRRVGANVRFVDVDYHSRGISPTAFEKAITSKTAAVVVVHLHGTPALLDEIQRIASTNKIAVVEDCAHAHGATINGRAVGTSSQAAAFSFYPTKNLGALGDGGAVVVHHRDAAQRLRGFRNYGQDQKGICVSDGVNTRLDEIQAAVLRILLHHLPTSVLERRKHACYYDEAFKALANTGRVTLPTADPGSAYHQYAIEVDDRDHVREKLLAKGIKTGVHYPLGLQHHPALKGAATQSACPVTDKLASRLLSLPIQPEIMDRQGQIISAVTKVLRPDG